MDGTFDHERLARMLVGIYRSQDGAGVSAVAQQADETMKAVATPMLQTIIEKIEKLDGEMEDALQTHLSLQPETEKAKDKVYNAKIYIDLRDVIALRNAKEREVRYWIKYVSLSAKKAVYEEWKKKIVSSREGCCGEQRCGGGGKDEGERHVRTLHS